MCRLSWFSGPGPCSFPSFHLRLGASDCSPGLASCFMGPWTFAWICCPQLSYHPCKNGTHRTCFYSTWGAHAKKRRVVLRFSIRRTKIYEHLRSLRSGMFSHAGQTPEEFTFSSAQTLVCARLCAFVCVCKHPLFYCTPFGGTLQEHNKISDNP